jgi:hypothetical protein
MISAQKRWFCKRCSVCTNAENSTNSVCNLADDYLQKIYEATSRKLLIGMSLAIFEKLYAELERATMGV